MNSLKLLKFFVKRHRSQSPVQKNVFDELYKKAKESEIKKETLKKSFKDECTFQPKLTRNKSLEKGPLIANYNFQQRQEIFQNIKEENIKLIKLLILPKANF